MKVSSNFNTNLYSFKSSGVRTTPVDNRNINNPPAKTDNTKKIVIGSAIVAGILVLFLARKNISKFLKEFSNNGEKGVPKDMPKASIPTDVSISAPKTIIPPSTKEFDGQKVLSEYKELLAKQKNLSECQTAEEKTLWNTQDEKRRELLNALCDNNISLVEKVEFSLDPNIDIENKRAYFLSSKISGARFNEASKLDYLEMFEKYGERYMVDEKLKVDSLTKLGTLVGTNASDKVLSKYMDIMDKLAIRDGKGNLGMRDAAGVLTVLQFNAQNMSKETLLKCIKVLKKISYQQVDTIEVETYLLRTNFKRDKDITTAVEDLKNALKDFPEEDRTMN